MTTLHVYSNRHIKDQVKSIAKGDWVYLENGMSRKRWSRYFSVNNINEDALNVTYITQEEFFDLKTNGKAKLFDECLMNAPYTDGAKLLYTYFFKKGLEVAENVTSVMPVDLESGHDKLKFHNQRVQKHLINMSENISHHFNVGYDNLHYVTASESVTNLVTERKDKLSQLPLLFPERQRMEFKSGNTECGESEEDYNGTKIVHSVLQGDRLVFKTIPSTKVKKSKAWTKAKYSVFINYTPSQGKFNCSILKDCDMTWTRKVFMIECDTEEQANKTKDWLQSETIRQEVLKMFKAKNNAYTVSLEMLHRLPHYE
jgi:hypothetical protein